MARVEILGCNGGIGGERRTMGLRFDGDILIDAGSGVGDLPLEEMVRIDHVFLTHSHLDHIALLPMLIDAAAASRQGPVAVHGLPDTLATLRECVFNGRLWPDYSIQPTPENPYFRYEPLAVGDTVRIGARTIEALPARHAVAGVGYRLDGGSASFVYSGDTTLYEPFWHTLNTIPNLRHLMVECTFLNANSGGAARSGHFTPALLAQGLALLETLPEVLIAHLESGQESRSWAEIAECCGDYHPRLVRRGEIFAI